MSLIIATGSNLGDKKENLKQAFEILSKHFNLIAQSRIYQSQAQDYLTQPDFLNQVLEFEIPSISAEETLQKLLAIENQMGRVRQIKYGPRVIDIDLIFYGFTESNTDFLMLPHPRFSERSFVVRPLSELPFAKKLEAKYTFAKHFDHDAFPYEK